MAYSKEVREQALRLCQNGFTDEQVSERLDISKHTITSWKKLLFDTGSLDKKKVKRKSGTPYKYTSDKISELLDKTKSAEIPKFADVQETQIPKKKDKKSKKKKKSKFFD